MGKNIPSIYEDLYITPKLIHSKAQNVTHTHTDSEDTTPLLLTTAIHLQYNFCIPGVSQGTGNLQP